MSDENIATVQSFEEFYALVKKLGLDICFPRSAWRFSSNTKETPKTPENAILELSWRTGGVTGGSCYGSVADIPVTGEPEPEFVEFDKLLESICPDITFLQYKRICSECIKTDSRTENEYYGNSNIYGVKTVNLRELYDVLCSKNILPTC